MAASSWREPAPELALKAVRCKACRRRLGDFDGRGAAQIVCPKCGIMNVIRPR